MLLSQKKKRFSVSDQRSIEKQAVGRTTALHIYKIKHISRKHVRIFLPYVEIIFFKMYSDVIAIWTLTVQNKVIHAKISGSHGGEYGDHCLLGFCAV
jgi:hypothetical protein